MANAEVQAGPDDLSPEYSQHREELFGKSDAEHAAQILRKYSDFVDVGIVKEPGETVVTKLEPFPTDRPPPSNQSTAGTVMRNIGEIVPSALGGVESAVKNAMGPLYSAVEWLNENVANLSFDYEPTTPTGRATKSLSEFLTGFIPAMKGLKAAGVISKIGTIPTGMAAGAIADFTVRDPHGDRLAKMWKDFGLPSDILNDWLAADEGDSGIEGRFKNAIEGVITGFALEGVLAVARAWRAGVKVRQAQQSEKDFLKERYGEIADEDRLKIIGDSGKPLVERVTVPVTSSTDALGKKWKVEAVAIKEGEKPLYFKITDDEGKELAHADFIEVDGKLAAKSVIVDKKLKGTGVAEMLYRAAAEKHKMPIIPGRAQTPEGAGFVQSMQRKGVIEGGEGAPAAEAVIGGRGVVKAGDQDFYINFTRLDKPDDIKNAIATLAQQYKKEINAATMGKITHDETKLLAADNGMTVEQLLSRRGGQPFNHWEATAARSLLNSSASNVVALARKAVGTNAGKLDHFAYRRAAALHAAIQSEVFGARTETARALSAWRIPVGDGVEQAKAIETAMAMNGGEFLSLKAAKMLVNLADSNAPASAINNYIRKTWTGKAASIFREVWVNGLLSMPSSQVANMGGSAISAFMSIAERGVASRIGALRGAEPGDRVAPGEAAALAHGSLMSIKNALAMAGHTFMSGKSQFGESMKLDTALRERAVSTETLGIASDTMYGRFVDFVGDFIVRGPGRGLLAGDEIFKVIGYNAEVEALALRQAYASGKRGAEMWDEMARIRLDPPSSIKSEAVDAALYRTFNDAPGEVLQAALTLRERIPAGWLVAPFMSTVGKLTNQAFERTPFAPLMESVRADIKAGGARGDLALARMAVGTAIMMSVLDLADSGMVVGSTKHLPPGEREAMRRQGLTTDYSIHLGDKWYSFGRLDPIGMLLGFAADAATYIRHGEIQQDDVDEWQEVFAMAVQAVGNTVINKTYMRGISEFFATVTDPTRRSENYISNMFASFLPFTSLAAGVERIIDPTMRESEGPVERMMARTPDLWEFVNGRMHSLGEKLAPQLTLWGDEVKAEFPIYDLFSPVRKSTIKPEPVDMEILRLAPLAAADNVEGSAPTRIAKRTEFMGVEINFHKFPKAYEKYVRLAGNDLKDPRTGLGAKDLLNLTVQGKGPDGENYRYLPDAARIRFINSTVSKFRQGAQAVLYTDPEFANFRAYVDETRALIVQRMREQPSQVIGQ